MVTVGWSTADAVGHAARSVGGGDRRDDRAGSGRVVPDLGRCVFNFHCPPKDTPIDTCLKLEVGGRPGELPRPDRSGGRFHYIGGGSPAVREAIARYQPVVGLHGHIHESGGRFRLGRTQMLQPRQRVRAGRAAGLDRRAERRAADELPAHVGVTGCRYVQNHAMQLRALMKVDLAAEGGSGT